MKKTCSILFVAILFGVFPINAQSTTPIAVGEPEGGMTCMVKMKDAFEPARSSMRKVIFSTKDDFGERVQLVGAQAYKKFPEGKKMVLVILGPMITDGTTYLFWEKKNQLDRWVYISSIRRVRKLPPTWPYDNFVNTDFTLSDIGFIPLSKSCELVETEKYKDALSYKVAEKLLDSLIYSRIVTWVETETFLPLKRDYYDLKNNLWKNMLFKEIVTIDGVPMPLLIEMNDVLTGTTTELRISNVVHDVDVPDDFFDPEQLSKVAASDLWKKYGIQTE